MGQQRRWASLLHDSSTPYRWAALKRDDFNYASRQIPTAVSIELEGELKEEMVVGYSLLYDFYAISSTSET